MLSALLVVVENVSNAVVVPPGLLSSGIALVGSNGVAGVDLVVLGLDTFGVVVAGELALVVEIALAGVVDDVVISAEVDK